MNEKLQHIIEALFEIAEPGNVKNSLWQAYQQELQHVAASALLKAHSGASMDIKFTYEGKIYKGTVPCVGVI